MSYWIAPRGWWDLRSHELRASDAERDEVAAQLREHCAAGRITLDELSERLDRTFAARTLGDLRLITRDLPDLARPASPPVPWSRRPRRAPVARLFLVLFLLALIGSRAIDGTGNHTSSVVIVVAVVLLAFRMAMRTYRRSGPLRLR